MAIKDVTITQRTTYRNRVTDSYFNEMKFPVLTPDQEVELFHKVRNGDKRAEQRITECNLRFVISTAKQYAPKNDPDTLLDLIQEGNMGLIHAIRDFDITKGFKFISFAVWHIRQRIMLYLGTNKTVRYTANVMQDRFTVRKIHDKLEIQLERKPNIDEIFDEFSLNHNNRQYPFTKDQIRSKIADYFSDTGSISSLDMVNTNSDIGYTLLDLMEDDTFSIENTTDQSDNAETVKVLLQNLNDRERLMLMMQFGLDGKLPSIDRAADYFNMTNQRIQQINAKSLQKLKRLGNKKILEGITLN